MPAHDGDRRVLCNDVELEAIPAELARPRGNRTARALAGADWLLRRKADGHYLAALVVHSTGFRLRPLGVFDARSALTLRTLAERLSRPGRRPPAETLPLSGLSNMLQELGIPGDYGQRHHLVLVPEPRWLSFAGHDRYRRPLWLSAEAAAAWRRMSAAARREGIALDAISGYRSHAYQLGIFRRKLARGLSVAEILSVNAAPGYSEHHSGRALDIGTPGQAPAEESFESTSAFAWLCRRAGDFGFVLSYPRGNRHGIVHEPWHWCWQAEGRRA